MMKLLSYHIENYGKLHDVDGTFEDGVTCICEKNGYGKTTLASFIKAMFYGLPTYTAKSKQFEDRQHFYPFAGGKFGGNLTFEKDGATYRIERFFDKKSNKGDELQVYCNGAPYDGFGEEIGRSLFGLDEESFRKTIFITVDEIEIASTHVINERLNHSSGMLEESGFESAIERLEKAKKSLKAARGNNDKIGEKSTKIKELTAQIENLKTMGNGLGIEYAERERLSKAITLLEKEEKHANEQALLWEKWERFDSMSQKIAEQEKALSDLREKYPLGLPQEDDRAALREGVRKMNVLQTSVESAEFGEEKQKVLSALETRFSAALPDEEIFRQQQENLLTVTELRAEIKTLSAPNESEREKELKRKFSIKCPTEDELAQARAAVEIYQSKDGELKALSASVLTGDTLSSPKKEKWRIFALIGGLACAGAGVGLTFAVLALGIVLIALGACAAIVSLFGNKGYRAVMSSELQINAARLQAEIKTAESKILSFTIPYGYYSEIGAPQAFSALDEDVKAFRAWEKAEQGTTRLIAEKNQRQTELVSAITRFLTEYGEDGEELQTGLNRLQSEVEKYRSLQADKDALAAKKKLALQQLEENFNTVKTLLKKYELSENVGTMDGLTTLEVDCEGYETCVKDYARTQAELAEYQEKNNLGVRPETSPSGAEDLRSELSEKRKELASCDKRIAETERVVEKLSDLEAELEQAKETLSVYKDKHSLLVDTLEMLQGAEQKLKDKYISPIKDRFSHYAQAIEKVLNEKISMDKDFRVVFERNGENRDDRHLSAGERAICALCLRLALIDNMYETEQPFIVMDDPFVHLDSEHLGKVAELMKELSKNRQILYFSCHESRQM